MAKGIWLEEIWTSSVGFPLEGVSGRAARRKQPELLTALREELGDTRFESSIRCCEMIRRKAGKNSVAITRAAMEWHRDLLGWVEPGIMASVSIEWFAFLIWRSGLN